MASCNQELYYNYNSMEKDNKDHESHLHEQKVFPNLKKSYSVSKNFIALTKVELDKNMTSIQQLNPKPVRQIASSLSHKRIISGLNSGQFVHSQFSMTHRKFYQPALQRAKSNAVFQHKSTSISHVSAQHKQPIQKPQSVPVIEKAKISSKPIGLIKGYSVNSHPGPLNASNQDRICIVTNLNKSAHKDQQILFFSIYDGNRGVAKAEFFRDNFHVTLAKDKQFFKDIQSSIKRSFITIQESFSKIVAEEEFPSQTNALIAIIFETTAYFISMGQNRMIISQKFGECISNPLNKKQIVKKAPERNKSKSHHQANKSNVKITKFDLSNTDFIILGSEGLFQNFDEEAISIKAWKNLMQKIGGNFHVALGQTTNSILKDVFQQTSVKNVSIIFMALQNVFQSFQPDNSIVIPFLSDCCPEHQEQFQK